MVRLEEKPIQKVSSDFKQFQFQYGAIRRYTYNEAGGDSFKFQFQYGAIRSVIKMLQKE